MFPPGKVQWLVRAARETSTTREHSARCRFTPVIAPTLSQKLTLSRQ